MSKLEIYTSIEQFGGHVVKDNDTYLLEDNTELSRLTVSKTTLHPGKETTGHKHDGVEEAYLFISGIGLMEIGERKYTVNAGSIILIPDGDFHKVYNQDPNEDLVFIAIFEKYDKR
jgi:mannose-6-phosphate isomerase-like protein (cupin superfamily)